MSLARAFTTRKVRMSNELAAESKMPQRSGTHKGSVPSNIRTKISGPVQLVHTTNMLSYNAPDLPRSSRSNSTAKSDTDSDALSTAESTPPTSPEASLTDDCPSPQPNHLSSYFIAPGKPVARDLQADSAPAIPKRSPSHTKKNSYDAIARQRSISQMSRDSGRTISSKPSLTFSRSSSTSTRASSTSHASSAQHASKQMPPPVPAVTTPITSPQLHQGPPPRVMPEAHPFGAELAQVTELAEEYSMRTTPHVLDEDEQYIQTHGLVKLSADDYMNDVQELFSAFFQQPPKRAPSRAPSRNIPAQPIAAAGPMWI